MATGGDTNAIIRAVNNLADGLQDLVRVQKQVVSELKKLNKVIATPEEPPASRTVLQTTIDSLNDGPMDYIHRD
jgi:cell division protein FtsB